MIPKVINYCWFGGNELPKKAKKCMESWKKHCPDYRIVEWNESNFDIHCHPFVEIAYKAKAWVFVSDYARLKVIYDMGLENKVIFCGAVKNVNDYLMAADIFLLPSLYEGMPFSLVEALVTGLPVLVSKNLQPSINITGNVNYLSLEDSETWLKSINKNIALSRTTLCKNNQKKLFEKGYDLNENLNRSDNFYCEKLSDLCEMLKTSLGVRI